MSLEEVADTLERVASHLLDVDENSSAEAVDECARELREAIRWIPVSERLPSASGDYLIALGSSIGVEHFSVNTSHWYSRGIVIYPAHWRPLPDPPDQA